MLVTYLSAIAVLGYPAEVPQYKKKLFSRLSLLSGLTKIVILISCRFMHMDRKFL